MDFSKFSTWVGEFLTATAGHMAGTGFEGFLKPGEKPTRAQSFGASLGAAISEARKKAEEREKTRAEFLHALNLIDARTNGGCAAIIALFRYLNRNGNVVWVQLGPNVRRPYREEWISKKLMLIPSEYRDQEFPFLNQQLASDPPAFYASLELLNEDEWTQRLREIKMRINANPTAQAMSATASTMWETVNDAASELAGGINELNLHLAAIRDAANRWARR